MDLLKGDGSGDWEVVVGKKGMMDAEKI